MSRLQSNLPDPGGSRRRALHEKSRSGKDPVIVHFTGLANNFPGCVTCKQRRVKCDEAQPACRNCRKGARHCSYVTPAPAEASPFRAFRHVVFEPTHFRNAIIVSDESRRSVEYFCLKSLPILRRCQHSPLWDYLVAQLLDTGPSVRSIAAALGAQQRLLDRVNTGEGISHDMEQQASRLYTSAIASLRQSIAGTSGNDQPQIPLACLLMVILESIRGSSTNLLVHLYSGFYIMRSQQGIPTDEVREVVRLLRQFAVDATVFDALSPSARSLETLVAEDFEVETDFSPLAQVVQLVSDVLRSIKQAAAGQAHDPDYSSAFRNTLDHMKPQQQNTEKAINDKLAAAEGLDSYSIAAYSFAKARCLMSKVYINFAWTGRQTDYDEAIGLFREIVDLEEKALRLMHSFLDGREGATDSPAAFSVGLSAQATLMLVVQQCRDFGVRRRAFGLLDQCPRFEGVRDTALIKAICRAIMQFEETAVGGTGIFITENCRVHHYRLIGTGQEPGDWRAVRLYLRNPERGMRVSHDILLDVG